MQPNKKTTIWISKTALDIIKQDLYKWYPCETGGVLMGYWNKKQGVITEIIDGGPNAIRTSTSFNPDHEYQLEEISRIYRLSGRSETYLGDWHTHPDSNGYLSSTDKKTLNRIAGFKPARQAFPIMMVCGTKPVETRIWCARKTILGTTIFELNLLQDLSINL